MRGPLRPRRARVHSRVLGGSGWLERIGRWRALFRKKAGVPEEGWERRHATRFELPFAAGRAGIAMGLLPWDKKELRLAVTACYRAAREAWTGGVAQGPGSVAAAGTVAGSVARLRAGGRVARPARGHQTL